MAAIKSEYNKEFFNKMVDFFNKNVGSVFALYDPKPGEIVKHPDGTYRPIYKANTNIKRLLEHVERYITNYKLYQDLPMVTISNDYKLLKITESWNNQDFFKHTTLSRGAFYDVKKRV